MQPPVSQEHPYQLVYCTCPSMDVAQQLAHRLVTERLVACVNIVPGVLSVYWWQQTLQQEQEWLLIIKTRHSLFEPLANRIQELHPYQVPEIISVPIYQGSPSYLAWLDANLIA